MLDQRELEVLCLVPEMKEWLNDVGLNEQGIGRIFNALVSSESGQINFDEFLFALTQMRGMARSSDLMIVSLETRKALQHSSALILSLERHLELMEKHIDLIEKHLGGEA